MHQYNANKEKSHHQQQPRQQQQQQQQQQPRRDFFSPGSYLSPHSDVVNPPNTAVRNLNPYFEGQQSSYIPSYSTFPSLDVVMPGQGVGDHCFDYAAVPSSLVIDESSDSNSDDSFSITFPDWVDKSLSDVLCCNYWCNTWDMNVLNSPTLWEQQQCCISDVAESCLWMGIVWKGPTGAFYIFNDKYYEQGDSVSSSDVFFLFHFICFLLYCLLLLSAFLTLPTPSLTKRKTVKSKLSFCNIYTKKYFELLTKNLLNNHTVHILYFLLFLWTFFIKSLYTTVLYKIFL